MAPEIPLDRQRPAEFVFERGVAEKLSEIREEQVGNGPPSRLQRRKARNAAALSAAAAISPKVWEGERESPRSDRAEFDAAAGPTAASASGGRLRRAGSLTARRIAKGTPRARAKSARREAFHVDRRGARRVA